MQDKADRAYRKLRTSDRDEEIFRAQGALEELGEIIELPATIRAYLHDVSTGKRKKIEPKEIRQDGMVGLNTR